MSKYRALLIEKTEDGFTRQVVERDTAELPEGDVLIDVHYSSLNYKDGLSATGNPGVTRNFPHTPGIDAAGVVVESAAAQFKPGDQVLKRGTFLRGVHDIVIGLDTSELEDQVGGASDEHCKHGTRHKNAPAAVAL